MTRETDNALLMHGGTEDIDIPPDALKSIIDDALKPDCVGLNCERCEALDEANQRLAKRIARLECENRSLKTELNGMEFDT